MRNLPARPALSKRGAAYLVKKTAVITKSADKKATAKTVYTSARQTKTFSDSVIESLKGMSGIGGRCMFCGSNESSQVDHFAPKDTYPTAAMTWENFVWICGVCNLNKGNRFPLAANNSPLLINPIDENTWNYFFIDKFGFMAPVWDDNIDDLDPRAVETEKIVSLNRQAVQEARQQRLIQLTEIVTDHLHKHGLEPITKKEKADKLASWLAVPFHPEVAQFFLSGPGKNEAPFSTFLAI